MGIVNSALPWCRRMPNTDSARVSIALDAPLVPAERPVLTALDCSSYWRTVFTSAAATGIGDATDTAGLRIWRLSLAHSCIKTEWGCLCIGRARLYGRARLLAAHGRAGEPADKGGDSRPARTGGRSSC